MKNRLVSNRIARLTGHFTSSESCIHDLHQNPTSSNTCQCYNFEPGRLLLNQVAIVTGAGSGIGKHTALLFAHHGAYVTISDIDEGAAQTTADFIRNSAGDRCIVVSGDVTSDEFPRRCIEATIKAFGELHIIVANAGFTWDGVIQKMTPKQWDMMLKVHCTAPFRLIQAAAPYMRDAAKQEIAHHTKAKPRCIITVSSVSGVHGNSGQINYATAKAGIVGFTKALAKEWGMFNIRANCVAFGHINTRLVQDKEKGASISVDGENIALGIPQASATANVMQQMIALGRVGAPEEAAGAMLMLASPYASYITGQCIEVTGGGWM